MADQHIQESISPLLANLVLADRTPPKQNPAAIYLASLAEGSRRTMREVLNPIATLLGVDETRNAARRDVRCLTTPWGQLRYAHTVAIRSALAETYAPATANKLLAALRRVLAVLRGTGLRRSEVAALNVADYEPQTGAIVVRTGKGNKDRRVYAPSGTIAALDAWLEVRGHGAGALFGRAVRGGGVGERRLADEGVAVILRERAAAAGMAPSHHTTWVGRISPNCSTPAPTWRRTKRWLAMKA